MTTLRNNNDIKEIIIDVLRDYPQSTAREILAEIVKTQPKWNGYINSVTAALRQMFKDFQIGKTTHLFKGELVIYKRKCKVSGVESLIYEVLTEYNKNTLTIYDPAEDEEKELRKQEMKEALSDPDFLDALKLLKFFNKFDVDKSIKRDLLNEIKNNIYQKNKVDWNEISNKIEESDEQ